METKSPSISNAALPAWERFKLYRDPTFSFDPATHITRVRDRIPWSVTGALRQAGIVNTAFYTPEGRVRGQHVHEACHYFDDGDLDMAALERDNPLIVGYVRAWEAFTRDFNFVPQSIELPMYCDEETGGVFLSCIPDVVGTILDGHPAIVERKSGSMMFWTAYQTAGQDLVLRAWDEKPVYRRRYGVALQANGAYKKPLLFEDEHDYDVMRAALVVSQAAGGVDRGSPPLETLG